MKQVQDVIKDLIINQGRNVVKKDRGIQSHIEDALSGYLPYKNISLNLAKEGILKSMANMQSLNETELKNLVRQITDKYGTERSKTEETIMVWAEALGVSVSVKKQSEPVKNQQSPKPSQSRWKKAQQAIYTSQPTTQDKGFFKKLINGDFGLATTYWGFGVLGNFLIGFLIKIYSHIITVGLSLIWTVMVLIGIWKAASKYQGFKLWAYLAKFIVVLSIVSPMALFIPKLVSNTDSANKARVCANMSNIKMSLDTYKVMNGQYPSTEEGLSALTKKDPMNGNSSYLNTLPSNIHYVNNNGNIELVYYGSDKNIVYSECNK